MKTFLYTIVLVLFSVFSAYAQTSTKPLVESPKGFSVKLYNSSFIFNSYRHGVYIDSRSVGFLEFGGFSLASSFATDKFVHELEAGYWQWEKETDREISTFEEYGLRYELGTYFKRPIVDNLWLRLGGGALFFRGQEDEQPKSPFDFPRVRNSIGIAVTFIPHLEYSLGEHWYLDLNLSFMSIALSIEESETFRPDLPASQRTFSNYSLDLGGVRQLRFGLGYRL